MSTRSRDQQKKQRQKEFKEIKEHQQLLKATAKKVKPDPAKNEDATEGMPKIVD
jgi:hypothetical protein